MSYAALMVVVLAASAVTAAAPAQASDPAINPAHVSKRVMLDPATGNILAITDVSDRIIQRHYCDGNDACFIASNPPYADHGFYGSPGTKNGNWPNRKGYYTGAYITKFCWNNNICAPELPPRHETFFPGGAIVTGSSVTIR